MYKKINCEKQLLFDALAQGSINVLCDFYQLAKRTLQNGGVVNIYEEFGDPVIHRLDMIFNNWGEFRAWFNATFPGIDCPDEG